MTEHTTDLHELLAAVRNLLMALKDVPYLPPPVWAALDEVRLAVAPDIGPPPIMDGWMSRSPSPKPPPSSTPP